MADENLSFSIIARDQASSAFRETARSATDLAGKMDIAARTGRVLDETLRKEVRAGDELSRSFAVSAKATDILKRAQQELAGDAAVAKDELRGVKREADRLDGTTANVHVKVNVDRSALDRIRGIFGGGSSGGGGDGGGILGKILGFGSGGAGAAGGGAQAAGGTFGNLPPQAQAVGIGAGVLGAALLGPGVIGAGLGGAVGLGAIGGGLFGAAQGTKILKADTANIRQITTGLKTAIGQQKAQLSAALQDANKQFAKDSAFYAPFLALQLSLKGLAQNILAPLRPVMAPLAKIIADFGKGLTALGPVLTQMFKASLPFIQQFAGVMLQSGKILIPAFTQALNEMVKTGSLKLMTQGLVILIQGFAKFIVAMGPGMKASAQIFVDVSKIVSGLLQGIGKSVSWLANVFNDYFHLERERLKQWRTDWDGARHDIAVVFDGIRHDVAAAWNATWDNTIGRLQRFVADDQKMMARFRHDIANAFDDVRRVFATVGHAIATTFDTVRHAQGQFDAFGKDIAFVRHVITDAFDAMRHGGAIAFDGLRHAIASSWDQMRHDEASSIARLVSNLGGFRHDAAAIFDALRHGIAAAWNQIWGNSTSQTQNGINGIVHWFRTLPGRAVGALFGLGHQLYATGRAALTEFLNGFKSVGGTVLSWVGNFAKNVWDKVKRFFGINSPSSLFYDIGKNLMLGLFHGIKDHAWKAAHAAQQAQAGLGGGFAGPGGGQPSANAALARRLVPEWGSGAEWQAWNALAMGESGWSNTIMNASSGAYGIAQALPASKYPPAGRPPSMGGSSNPTAQITWMASYIRGTPGYGDPISTYAKWLSRSPHWYAGGTSSAAPGWAVVGERGPELLHFGGGEQVYPQAAGGSGRGGDQSALLEAILDRLDTIADISAAAPHQTGRALGDTLNGVARSSAYSSMYGSR